MASRATSPGTPTRSERRLSEVARLVVQPDGIVSTGWPDVERTCSKMGITFDEWQKGAGRLILAKRADGLLAATVGGVGMSLPRQVGKTYLLAGLTFALCANTPGLLVIWTAHHLKTAGETFLDMQGYAEKPGVAPFIDRVYTGSGDEEIRFKNGSRILFGARERGFGRGIPGVDALIFDEAQILSDKALEAMLATMNTSRLGLHLYIGTPPRPTEAHMAESFTSMRQDAHAGTLEDSAWIECGADKDADPDDREQWGRANPSYPHRTPVQAFLRLKKKLKLDGFLREGLGIWDTDGRPSVFGPGAWESVPKVGRPADLALGALGVAVSIDLEYAAVVGAAEVDGSTLLRVVAHGSLRTDQWLLDTTADLHESFGCPVVIDGKGPGADYVPRLTERVGEALHVATLDELKDACSGLFKAVRSGEVVHACDDPHVEGVPRADELDFAVAEATKRDVGDRWLWGRRKSGDISSLEAATLAAWGLTVDIEPAPESAYETHGVLTV